MLFGTSFYGGPDDGFTASCLDPTILQQFGQEKLVCQADGNNAMADSVVLRLVYEGTDFGPLIMNHIIGCRPFSNHIISKRAVFIPTTDTSVIGGGFDYRFSLHAHRKGITDNNFVRTIYDSATLVVNEPAYLEEQVDDPVYACKGERKEFSH